MIDRRARALIAGQEACRLTAYADSVGVWTIGWGSTRGVKPGDTCTQEQADQRFAEDITDAEAAVDKYVTRLIGKAQRGALVSLVFNVGPRALTGSDDDEPGSTLLHAVNDGHNFEAARQFAAYIFAGGKPLRGLLRRRLAEAALFSEDPWPV